MLHSPNRSVVNAGKLPATLVAAALLAIGLGCREAAVATGPASGIDPAHRAVALDPGTRYVGYHLEPEHMELAQGRANVAFVHQPSEITKASNLGLQGIYWLDPDYANFDSWLANWIATDGADPRTGTVAAFYVDEPYARGRTQYQLPRTTTTSQVAALINAVKGRFPNVPFALVESAGDLPIPIPAGLDWIGMDCYGGDGWEHCAIDSLTIVSVAQKYRDLKLSAPGLRLILTPPSAFLTNEFSKNIDTVYSHPSNLFNMIRQRESQCSATVKPTCNDQQHVIDVAQHYDSMMVNDPAVVAMFGFTGDTYDEGPLYIGSFDLLTVDNFFRNIFTRVLGHAPQPILPLPVAATMVVSNTEHNVANVTPGANIRLGGSNPTVSVSAASGAVGSGINVACVPSGNSYINLDVRVRVVGTDGTAGVLWNAGTLSNKRYTLQCRTPGLPGVTATLSATTGPFSFHFLASGAGIIAADASSLQSTTFTLLDDDNVPVAGEALSCVASSGASIVAQPSQTDELGHGTVSWRVGSAHTDYTVSCSARSGSGTSSQYRVAAIYTVSTPNGDNWTVPVNARTTGDPYLQIKRDGVPYDGATITCTPSGTSTVANGGTRVTGSVNGAGSGTAAWTWYVGSTPGVYAFACTSDVGVSYTFHATATAPTYTISTPNGDNWTVPVNTRTAGDPYLQIKRDGVPYDGATITCTPSGNSTVANGGTRVTGSVNGAGSGTAAWTWYVGSTPGTYAFACTSDVGASYTFHATATAPANAYHMTAANGDWWSVPVGSYTGGNPYVLVQDASGTAVNGVTVTCVPSAGSRVDWASMDSGQTNQPSSGYAVWRWQQTAAGSHTLSCTAPNTDPITFHASAY